MPVEDDLKGMKGGSSAHRSSGKAGKKAEAPAFVDKGAPLPSGYGDTRLTIMPRDPGWGYAYWEVALSKAKEIAAVGRDASCRPVLRLYRLRRAGGERLCSSMGVDLSSGNWYFRVPRDDTSYVAELGFMCPGKRFVLIARSNVMHIPRGRVSDRDDHDWSVIRSEFNSLINRSGLGTGSMGSHTVAKMILERMRDLVARSAPSDEDEDT